MLFTPSRLAPLAVLLLAAACADTSAERVVEDELLQSRPPDSAKGGVDASRDAFSAVDAGGTDASTKVRPSPESPEGRHVCGMAIVDAPRRGIDVSHHNGQVDWARVAASGVNFAFARVSDGLDYPDTEFARNYSGMAKAGIVRGAYQYFRPNGDALAQAKFFVSRINANGGWHAGDLPPAIDIEVINTTASAQQLGMKIWIEYVQAQLRVRPIVYTYRGASGTMGGCFTDYPIWIASWVQPDCPSVADAWPDAGKSWQFWQHTDSGAVPGVSSSGGGVDLNVFNGDEVDFQAALSAAVIPAGASTAARITRVNCTL